MIRETFITSKVCNNKLILTSVCNVGLQQSCPYEGDFKCKTSGRCIHPRYVCDGRSHCEDGSDEQNCGT